MRFYTVSEDLDGIPIKGPSSPAGRNRKRESKSIIQTPVVPVATSKWDNIDNPDPPTDESSSSTRKKSKRQDEDIFADVRSCSDEDLDGAPLDSSPETTRHGSRSKDSLISKCSRNIKFFI